MPVFRVERNKGYTVMSNHHLRNKDLTLKAKGLLSQMLSLPEDWDYTLKGLALINREKIDAIRQAIRELEQAGYIVRSRERDERGRLRGADYVIYEQPQTPPALDLPTLENPTLDNPTQEKPMLENPTQLNKDIQSKDPRITDLSITHQGKGDGAVKPDLKKLIITNLPYLLFVWLFGKVGEAWRLAAGADASQKMLHFMDSLAAAFANGLPSFHPFDLCIGIVGAVIIRLAVYLKGKNAKKYRHGMEYGSARFGNAKDIAPYIDPAFENNILLTQTERLTMNGRPKDPKTARNKNVLVIGGSGSGKTRIDALCRTKEIHLQMSTSDIPMQLN